MTPSARDSGNPIRGPLGVHRGADRRFWFYGADYTLEAQIEYLNGLRKVTEEELRTFMTGKELKVLIPKRFRAAVQAITKAVNCTGSPTTILSECARKRRPAAIRTAATQ